MNKTLFGLALLSHNWENNRDIIDSYVSLVCSSIKNKNYTIINRELIKDGLLESFGIIIPLGACETILKRMNKDGILKKESGEYSIIDNKLHEKVKFSQKNELDAGFKDLVLDLTRFSKEILSTELSSEEVESGIITFFKENDLELLYANNNGTTVLPKVKESKKIKYIIAKFITDLQSKDPLKFNMVLKLAKGYTIASLITYADIQFYTGNLNEVEIYLDSPIIFNLLGLNGESNLKLSQELIESIKTYGAKLRIFDVNYGEVVKTIEDSVKRLNTNNYDITKSSRVLRTAIRENISGQELQIKLNQLDSILNRFSVTKTPSPSLESSEWKFQIDESKLSSIIEDLYQTDLKQKLPWYKTNQIERDVESISNIFKIRKQAIAKNLKSSRAIFLTSNQIIAFGAKKYEATEWEFKSTIPVCVTDIFLSTILWANYPTKNDELNIKVLISECYNIIELDNKLLTRFYTDIEKMHKDNIITNEQFYLLSASNLTYTLLEQKTLNDIDEYTDKTPKEILEDLSLKINANLEMEKSKNTVIDFNLLKIATFISKLTFYIIAIILISISLILKAVNPKLDGKVLNVILWSLFGLIGIFGFLRWMEIIPTKLKIETFIKDIIYNKLKDIITK